MKKKNVGALKHILNKTPIETGNTCPGRRTSV